VPSLSDRMMNPLVGLGARLSRAADHGAATGGSTVTASMLLGVATGLLWAPCAGPVLGLILTGAALQGASAHTTLLLLAYAAGASTSLALALLIGGRVLAALKRSLGAGEWIRRGLGVAGSFPSLAGAVAWLNSPPLTAAALGGKVVLVDFWTYSCINCLRAIPYV